jgi:hypothetical protein
MSQACGALRDPVQDKGWECYGTGLIVVTSIYVTKLPVVLPRRALEIVDPESWWDLPVRDFTGGDHAHLVVPRRPTTFRGDMPVLFGDAVVSYQKVGFVVGGADIFPAFFAPANPS